ncbi:MAG: CpsD/CapB family tyrosine-protein kinase [Vicinamibacterales bacterium]
MSRIDEAIRRAQGPGAPAPEADAAGPGAFEPAWSVADQPEAPAPAPTSMLAEPGVGTGGVLSPETGGGLSISSEWRDRLATGPSADPTLVEQFRRLAGTLHHARQSHGLRSVMVTSAGPNDGKTLTSINLALVLAESYRYRVLLVDADLRRPSITSVVEMTEGTGLSEALRSPTPQKLALAQLAPRLTLLPAGRPTVNSIEALVSPRMQQILDEALVKFDWVILDAPPVGPTADARLLSQMAGGTLFVVRAGKSQYPEVSHAIDVVGRDQILGVVLNDVEASQPDGYYYAADPKDVRS